MANNPKDLRSEFLKNSKEYLSGDFLDLEDRWCKGIPHDPRTKEIYEAIADLDFHHNNDYLCLKDGGDGDNGEELMYLLDMYFELKDKEK